MAPNGQPAICPRLAARYDHMARPYLSEITMSEPADGFESSEQQESPDRRRDSIGRIARGSLTREGAERRGVLQENPGPASHRLPGCQRIRQPMPARSPAISASTSPQSDRHPGEPPGRGSLTARNSSTTPRRRTARPSPISIAASARAADEQAAPSSTAASSPGIGSVGNEVSVCVAGTPPRSGPGAIS